MQSSRTHSTNNFNILYYNARSLLPKFDELLISVDNYQPDIVCITESLLCSDIHDSELLLPGYQCLRYDRNRHGGGLMYVLHKYIVKRLSSHPSLELLAVIVHCRKRRLCVSLFYRLPSSSVDVLHSLHSYLESINIPQFFSFLYLLVISILIFWTGLILPFLVLIIFFLLFV